MGVGETMACVFSYDNRHNVTEANFNYYAAPFVHPKRKMKEHDFIYMLSGKWKIGQDGEVFNLQQDSVLILNGGLTHYGVSAVQRRRKNNVFPCFKRVGRLYSFR